MSNESVDISLPIKRSTAKKQRIESRNDAIVSEAYAVMQTMKDKLDCRSNDEVQVLSAGVAAKLRQIKNDRIKLLVQRDIDNLLYDAILGTGKYSNVNTPMPSPYSGSDHVSFSPNTSSNNFHLTANDNRVDHHQSTEYGSPDEPWYMK